MKSWQLMTAARPKPGARAVAALVQDQSLLRICGQEIANVFLNGPFGRQFVPWGI
jgi:hypothetical protein